MFGSWVLEVAIGLVLVFVLFSTICAALREGIEAWTKTRAAYLERGIRELLHDLGGAGLARQFYEHPLIQGLSTNSTYQHGANKSGLDLLERGRGLPSYIPARSFAAALIDLAARGPLPDLARPVTEKDEGLTADVLDMNALRTRIAGMPNQRVARALLNAMDLANNDLDKTRQNLEAWYDAGMDRVSGWYKRSTQWIIFWIALTMAVMLNVDAIGISNFLYRNDNVRQAVVLQAEKAVADKKAADPTYKGARSELESLNLPIGWRRDAFECVTRSPGWACAGDLTLMVIGWVLAALAATLGAPFWFDILNRIMVIRSTVKPHEKSRPEGSEDRR